MDFLFEIREPDAIECKCTITMKLSEWRTLMGQLEPLKEYPATTLKLHVDKLVTYAEQQFHSQPDE
jgi:hypothetical protein